jgi:hypothetical protein
MRHLHTGHLAVPALLLLLGQTGCSNLLASGTSATAGIASAGIANSFTKSAAVATGIGLGVAAGANAGLQYAERVVHKAEQDRIAEAAGRLPPDVVGTWSVVHRIPIEDDEHGEVVVVRDIGAVDFACKEIVFSVDTGGRKEPPRRSFFTAVVCRDNGRWQWASAEPATARWGSLQ